MGLSENPTSPSENQEGGQRRRMDRRPRTRRCLLKGCEQRFRPRQARQRYCSGRCRQAARDWSRWKAQERYRTTAAGKGKRNGQSRRYRKRARDRKPLEQEVVPEAARVITIEHFFRCLLRPARLLREVRAPAAQPAAAVLFAAVPACVGARLGARTALATDPRRLSRFSAHERTDPDGQIVPTY
jgi:hypothetical protein